MVIIPTILHNQPEIDLIRPEFSTAWYPKND